MAMQSKKRTPGKSQGVWKPFFTLLKGVQMPWFWLLLVLLVNLFGAQLSLIFPDVTSNILAGDLSVRAITLFIVIMFLSGAVSSIHIAVTAVASGKVNLNFQRFVLKKVMRLPIPFYDKNMADQLISRTTDDTTKMSYFLTSTLPVLPSKIYSLVGVIAILFSYDWRLVVLAALVTAVMVVRPLIAGRLQFKWNARIQERLAELTGHLAEAMQNIPLTKIFVQEQREQKSGLAAIRNLYQTKVRYLLVGQGVSMFADVEGMVQLLINVLGGVYLIRNGYITVDIWIAYYMYTSTLKSAVNALPDFWMSAKTAQGASLRISEIANEEDEAEGGQRQLRAEQGDIAFENVSFAYSGQPVLQNLNFTIPQGKTTVIVGRSGEGKSTLFGLLERFYQPGEGRITIGGRDIGEYNIKDWRKSIGYVSQNTNLLSGTVRDCITYGVDRPVSQEEIEAAARSANAYEFIMDMENGFDTQVGVGGSKLSGGQRQRICIARELLKDPVLLLLDEATSSLDMEAEYQVTQALNRLKEGRTTLMVSHRLYPVVDADQVVYLKDHQVSGAGTHLTLLRENDSYRELIRAQQVGAAS